MNCPDRSRPMICPLGVIVYPVIFRSGGRGFDCVKGCIWHLLRLCNLDLSLSTLGSGNTLGQSTGWVQTNPLVFWYGMIYVHQLRICHFLQGIWLIGHEYRCKKNGFPFGNYNLLQSLSLRQFDCTRNTQKFNGCLGDVGCLACGIARDGLKFCCWVMYPHSPEVGSSIYIYIL
jgi:hypothetical protein